MDINKKKEFIINSLCLGIIIIAVIVFFKFLLPFLVPFLLAFLIAYLLKKPIDFLHKKCRINSKVSVIISVVLFYIVIGVLCFILGFGILRSIESFVHELPGLYTIYAKQIILNITADIENFVLSMGNNPEAVVLLENTSKELITFVTQSISKISLSLVSWGSGMVGNIPGLFIKLVLMIISTFFISMDFEEIIMFFRKLIGNKASNLIHEIKSYVFGTILVCLKSYIIIMSITCLELMIGFLIIGIKNAMILALLISFLDILPVLGTGGVLIPWSIISFILGDVWQGFGILILYLVITVVRNIIEPKIVGGQLGLHPLVTLISMFVGVNLAGIIGLFGFPILLSLLVHLYKKGLIQKQI